MKITKLFGRLALILIAIIGIALTLNYIRNREASVWEPKPIVSLNHKIPEQTYTQPSIKLPFIKDHAPIAQERLPIPPQKIEKTITIETSQPSTSLALVIDKKGNIYTTKDTPKDIKISVVKWKPSLFEITSRFGVTTAYSGKNLYFCLSYDLLRINKFFFGGDIGAGHSTPLLIGIAGRYSLFNFSENVGLSIAGGWNFVGNKPYIGITVSW